MSQMVLSASFALPGTVLAAKIIAVTTISSFLVDGPLKFEHFIAINTLKDCFELLFVCLLML